MPQASLIQMQKLSEELLAAVSYLLQTAEDAHDEERQLDYEEMLEIATRVDHDIQLMIAETRRLGIDSHTESKQLDKGAADDPIAE